MQEGLRRTTVNAWCVAAVLVAGLAGLAGEQPTTTSQAEMSLDECISMALKRNCSRRVSHHAVEVAEAQHRQALAGYWPQIGMKGGFMRMDESPNFIFPSKQMGIPAQSFSLPAGTATISVPAQFFNPLAPAGATIDLPVTTPAQTIPVPGQVYDVPEQDVKLMEPDTWAASGQLTWLLLDGGLRKGLRTQAAGGLEVARQEARRTDLEIIDSVKRMYYGAVLARQLRQIGENTLARMDATLGLTERMYKEGSGAVKKTDYLDNRMMVESLRSMVAMLGKNTAMSQAALANTIGLPWDATIQPRDTEIPYKASSANLRELVANGYKFSPDWGRLEAGLRAAEGALTEARSGHWPKVALTGTVSQWWNQYDGGMATSTNKESWSAGLAVEFPLFDGFLTKNRVAEAKARLAKMRAQELLLRDGLALQIKSAFLDLKTAQEQYQCTHDAMGTAIENRELKGRAYQAELVDTEVVIRSQIMEAVMKAQHYKVRYDHAAMRSKLDLIIGSEMRRQIGQPAKNGTEPAP